MRTFCLLLSLAFLVSCSSSRKPKQDDAAASASEEFVLSGSSDSGNAGGLRTIYFDYETAQVSRRSQSDLDHNLRLLQSYPSLQIQIEGHCDERGGSQFNLALGERRARALRDYFRAKGIHATRMETISFGKERPLDPASGPEAWNKNRRANLVITAK